MFSKVTFFYILTDKVNVFQYVCFSLIRNYCNGCVIRDYNGAGFFHYGIFVSVSSVTKIRDDSLSRADHNKLGAIIWKGCHTYFLMYTSNHQW